MSAEQEDVLNELERIVILLQKIVTENKQREVGYEI